MSATGASKREYTQAELDALAAFAKQDPYATHQDPFNPSIKTQKAMLQKKQQEEARAAAQKAKDEGAGVLDKVKSPSEPKDTTLLQKPQRSSLVPCIRCGLRSVSDLCPPCVMDVEDELRAFDHFNA